MIDMTKMFESILSTASGLSLPVTTEIFVCIIGRKVSKAMYYLDDAIDVVKLLQGLATASILEDIPSLVPEDEADLAYQKFAYAWDSLVREKKSNDTGNLVLRAIRKVYLKENIFIASCSLLRTIAVVVLPLLLYAFVNYSNRDEENLREGLAIVGCLIITKVVESLSQRHSYFDSRRSGMRMRSALMVAIYKKQLKLSSLGRKRHSTGEIVNYIAVDAYRMGEFPWWFHSTWSFTLQLFLAIAVLFGVVGLGALPGLIPLLICGLLNVPFARILQRCQSEIMIAQDERLRSTSEILNSMKIIKLQSWEEKFKNLIESRREKNLNGCLKHSLKRLMAQSCIGCLQLLSHQSSSWDVLYLKVPR
ncbi:hypothetical protein LWI28_017759 [Acer negundo]|uniref:ABC transmembrane type-1 domain-containing protein n=1 Tax=Acer negundo TaxID=4023 RepID=A0AAD5NJR0_ACENE|nr:hypothetical protein LWI28_017759 [Acer negundo]